ncbi:hypothetical protein AB0K00_45375 [Dactylosporangium sp. NPDC049525]|uniref:hypothetical protein n=1 Tax=Dactylosporangium sp. NPDC049525 TaxID=3154730 RepID=UPI00343EDD82
MASSDRLPLNVQQAVIAVCRDAIHFRDDLQAAFEGAGVPPELYARYNNPDNSKAKIARYVLSDLASRGEPGYAVQHKIVEDLCRLGRPHKDAPDQAAGVKALADLRREATAAQILVSPAAAAAEARRAADLRRVAAVAARQEKLGSLRKRFLDLSGMTAPTRGDRQSRGYELERLLADLFRLHDLEYRPSYQVNNSVHAKEQVDGSFHFRGFTYLVEAKWRAAPPDFGELADFKAKVDGKMDSTRGMFVAMAGFDQGVLDQLVRVARGSRNNIFMIDGRDIALLFEGTVGLIDGLTSKIDAAEQEGSMWRPFLT